MNQQAVTTKTDAHEENHAVEDGGAQDDLEKLLDEYDGESKKVEQKGDEDPDKAFIKEFRQKEEAKQARQDIDSALSEIRKSIEDIDIQVPEGLLMSAIRGKLETMAAEDERISKAWINRGSNPAAWKKAIEIASKAVRSEFNDMPDKKVTDDRDSIAAAVRSASNKSSDADDEVDVGSLNDAEFAKYKMGLLRRR